jgi:hypothetical protein
VRLMCSGGWAVAGGLLGLDEGYCVRASNDAAWHRATMDVGGEHAEELSVTPMTSVC